MTLAVLFRFGNNAATIGFQTGDGLFRFQNEAYFPRSRRAGGRPGIRAGRAATVPANHLAEPARVGDWSSEPTISAISCMPNRFVL